ncbi:hypothetical protein GCK32_022837, partial [Trichostrongylus colubriformis]
MEFESRYEEAGENMGAKPQFNSAMASWTSCGYMSNRQNQNSTARSTE